MSVCIVTIYLGANKHTVALCLVGQFWIICYILFIVTGHGK